MFTLQQTVKVCQSWARNQHCQIVELATYVKLNKAKKVLHIFFTDCF